MQLKQADSVTGVQAHPREAETRLALSRKTLIDLYTTMLTIRRFEERVVQ